MDVFWIFYYWVYYSLNFQIFYKLYNQDLATNTSRDISDVVLYANVTAHMVF